MKCYKSKWILTSEGEILKDYAIVVDEGKIIDIIPNSKADFEEKYLKDLGNSVITPGFIDLFTQLQYTEVNDVKPKSLKNKLKRFIQSISKKYTFAGVNPHNYSLKWADILNSYFSMDRNEKISSFKTGVEESIKSGTTCIAQVSREYKYFDIINKIPIKNYLFFEVYADSTDKSKRKFKDMRDKVENLVFHKGEIRLIVTIPCWSTCACSRPSPWCIRSSPVNQRVVEMQTDTFLLASLRYFLDDIPFERGGIHDVVGRILRVEHGKTVVVAGRYADVFRAACLDVFYPLVGIELSRIESS